MLDLSHGYTMDFTPMILHDFDNERHSGHWISWDDIMGLMGLLCKDSPGHYMDSTGRPSPIHLQLISDGKIPRGHCHDISMQRP